MRKDILITAIVFLISSALGLFVLPISHAVIIVFILLIILPFCAFIKKKELFIRTISIIAATGSALLLLLIAASTNQATNKILLESDGKLMLYVNNVTVTDRHTVCEVFTESTEDAVTTGHIKATLYINGVYDVLEGQSIVADVSISRQDGITGTRIYDLLIKDIPVLFASQENIVYKSVNALSVKLVASKVNRYLSAKLDSLPSASAGIAKAMLLGSKDSINEKFYRDSKLLGISHLFAVSGLHISIIFRLSMLVTLPIMRFRKTRVAVVLLMIWGFAFITRLPSSCLRAGFMTSFLLLSMFFHRDHSPVYGLFTAAALIVFVDPASLCDIGFLLSFLSTAGILLLYKPIKVFLNRRKFFTLPVIRKIVDSFTLSLSATIPTVPLLIINFGGISSVFLLANLLILPLAPLLLILPLLYMLLSDVPFFSEVLSLVYSIVVWLVQKITDFFASFKYVFIGLSYSELIFPAAFTVIILLLVLLFIKRKRAAVLMMSAVVVINCTFAGVRIASFQNSNVCTKVITTTNACRFILYTKDFAVVIADANDTSADNEVIDFLRGKNVHSIYSYVAILDDRVKSASIKALNEKFPVKNVVLLHRYNKLLTPDGYVLRKNLKLVRDSKDATLVNTKEIKIDCYLKGTRVMMNIEIGDRNIIFTNSKRVLYKYHLKNFADAIFYCGEYSENMAQFNRKCVILLKRPIQAKSKYKNGDEITNFYIPINTED